MRRVAEQQGAVAAPREAARQPDLPRPHRGTANGTQVAASTGGPGRGPSRWSGSVLGRVDLRLPGAPTVPATASGPPASKASKPASSRIGRPSSRALASFEPAFSPTTTKSVLFDTLPAALPPRTRIASLAPSRV